MPNENEEELELEPVTDTTVTEPPTTEPEKEPATEPEPEKGTGEEKSVYYYKTTLHKINRESAARRITIKNQAGQIQTMGTELEQLKTKVTEYEKKEKTAAAGTLFNDVVKEKNIEFVSEVASTNIRNGIFESIDWTKEVTKEALQTALDNAIKSQPYAVKEAPELPSTDGGKKSSASGVVDVDMDAIAREFNIQN